MEKPLWKRSIVFRLDKGDAQRLIESVRLSCGALEEESSKKITTSVLQADPYNGLVHHGGREVGKEIFLACDCSDSFPACFFVSLLL
ncbi:hypothetical protein NPIL_670371 [Nephila pilipes]|uniref:Uncharacterized protein n=1 Tax=Nephila pilipes TaxID=299642 RepID=A0A8X6U1S0_NEPPI|nr:hypothetical protein NPIL_670371 [Nephila pilipes]